MWAKRKNDLKCMLLEFQKERKGKKKMETGCGFYLSNAPF